MGSELYNQVLFITENEQLSNIVSDMSDELVSLKAQVKVLSLQVASMSGGFEK